jgi:cell wall-associated NlpC family hydrolase
VRVRALTTPVIVVLALSLAAVPAGAATRGNDGGATPAPGAGGATPAQGNPAGDTGGQAYGQPNPAATPTTPGAVAKIVDGLAYAPAGAPEAVQKAIWAANQIIGRPYVYGGGHRSFRSNGYDCSGTVSYALHGGGLLASPLDSSSFMRWGDAGPGQWITIWTNHGHAFVIIAGLRLDTSAAGDPGGLSGPRWRPVLRPTSRFHARHPTGL